MLRAALPLLLLALAVFAIHRARARRAAGSFAFAALFTAAALAQGWLSLEETRFESRWDDLSREELEARAARIAGFLRDRGSKALGEIRAVGGDADTRALLAPEPALAQAARRPVFLDLLERFPRAGNSGATVYDAQGRPRAWSGWTPTATMSLAREPSQSSEIVEIRQGNIFTILEATHPIRGADGGVLGYVVYQEPLRIEFPLHNRFLRVEDRFAKLEGGAGVRADVALEIALEHGDEVGSIVPGAAKFDTRAGLASMTCALVGKSGAPAGRVSLSGLSREGLAAERLVAPRRARAALLLAAAAFAVALAWRRLAARPLARFAGLVLVRAALLRVTMPGGLDPLGLFDPSWFASIRYAGLLRSPGDLALTAATALLAGRELIRFLHARESAVASFGRRFPYLSIPLGAIAALLVGSLVGLHWARVVDVARNANVPLYGGLDPFTSAPVAALEVGLLLFGAAFLVWGSALLAMSRALFARAPVPVAVVLSGALAIFASAVKMGDPATVSANDLLRPMPALLALAIFGRWAARRPRLDAPVFLAVAALAAGVNFIPLLDGFEARRRELVELRALEHGESPSNSRHFLLETALESFASNDSLRRALEDGPSLENANLAFILWARSPLAGAAAGCHLRLLDPSGNAFSTFSLGFPPELLERAPNPSAPDDETETPEIRFRREEIGSERIDVYSGHAALPGDGGTSGAVEMTLAYFDRLGQPRFTEDRFPSIFEFEDANEEFLRFARDVPDRVDRYRGEILVASTDPEGGLGYRVPSVIVQALESAPNGGSWVERRIGGSLYDLFCVRERDGVATVGYLTFGLKRHGILSAASLFGRSLLVTLVLAAAGLAVLMALPPTRRADGSVRVRAQFGFRERVIGGFLVVSLLPTVFLGVAGRGLFVQEKRRQFQARLEEDLRVSRELLSRALSDAASNAANSSEVKALFAGGTPARALSAPTSVDGLVVVGSGRVIRGASVGIDPDLIAFAREAPANATPNEYFRKRGRDLFACAIVPAPEDAGGASAGAVLAFQKIDAVLAAELERRVGSSISVFADGVLAATSKPELYQSEVLSDLVESLAYQKVELEGARRAILESRLGASSFLSNYAPLSDENGRPVGLLATIAPFHGGGLDLDASLVLSRIYFLCLLVLASALAAAVLLANRLTRPILDLTLGAERIGAGELGHRITTRAGGEIRALVRSFNSMSERLAQSDVRDRERREFIEAIIRHVGSGVISFDAGGRVATVNEAAGRILGAEGTTLLGRGPDDPGLSREASAVLEASRALVGGKAEEVVREIELVAEGTGETRSIRLVGTPLRDREGRAQGAVIVFEDLTDLIRSKKITAWAEMARQVAHEIKNPLTPMKLSAQHLQQAWKDRHPKLDQILRESTETIIDRCEALRRIAIEFADYARMPGRKIRTEDLGHLVREARRLYGDADERRVTFDVDAPEGSLFTRVDKDEVMRLFINLIENSIQAMPAGGDLAIRAWGENGHARVSVRDSGQGISPENLGRIFEPSFSTKTGGAGLGLPICRAIMEDYGGSIAIKSEIGRGTTVELTFPSAEENTPAPAAS